MLNNLQVCWARQLGENGTKINYTASLEGKNSSPRWAVGHVKVAAACLIPLTADDTVNAYDNEDQV